LEDTLKFGEEIGKKLKGGEVIELVGDVGVGKTAFVRGLAQGFKSDDEVASPSFVLSRIYKNQSGLEIAHYDFHRLNEAGIMQAEINESIKDRSSIVAVEWADLVEGVLPDDRLVIKIENGEKENERKFVMLAGKAHEHLIVGLQS